MDWIHSLLSRADTRGSVDIKTVCDAYRYFVGPAVTDVK